MSLRKGNDMTNPLGLFGHNFASVLSQIQLTADGASLAVTKLISAAPRPHDGAGLSHVCTGALASASAALQFLRDPTPTAQQVQVDLVALKERVLALCANFTTAELAAPRGRALAKFPGWKMLMALGQDGVSEVCLIAAGLLLLKAWLTDGRIPRKQALDIATEAQSCDLSVEGLRLLLVSDTDASDTPYPWLGQLQRNWPKLLNLLSVEGGNHPPPPPSFTHRARGQLLAAAEHASVPHRAGTPDHRHLSEAQFTRACQLVVEWNAQDDWKGVYAETGALSRLTADMLGDIPLASATPESWIVVINADEGTMQSDCSCVAADAAAAPQHGNVLPSGFVSTKPYSIGSAASLRRRRALYPDAKTLSDLYPEAPRLKGEEPLAPWEGEIRLSWARWINSFGLYMRRARHDSFLSATASNDFGHVPKSKLFYASVTQTELWAAMDVFFKQIGWLGAQPINASGIGFGCRVVPTNEAIGSAAAWQLQKLNEVWPPQRADLARLLEFHNRYVRVIALRLAALLGLREDTCYEVWADIDERDDLWVELLDKVVTGAKGALPVPLCRYARKLIAQFRKHCAAMASRLETMRHKDTPLHLWFMAVVARERMHLLCLASDIDKIRPVGSGDVIGRLPPEHPLAPDFGRKLLENQLRRLTTKPAEQARRFRLRSTDIDAVLRHEVIGQWRYASSSDFVLLDWIHRVVPALDAIAEDIFGDVPSGLSKE